MKTEETNNESFLDKIPKKNNYDIPANYFEELKQTVQSKIETNDQLLLTPRKRNLRPVLYLIASVAAIWAFVLLLPYMTEQNYTAYTVLQNNASQLEMAIEHHLFEIEEETLLSMTGEDNSEISFHIYELENYFFDSFEFE
jgi:hypothetical protein